MTYDTTPGWLAGFGIIGFILMLVIGAAVIALEIWVAYAIIWRAVRRGLREFYQQQPPQRPQY